MCTRIKVGNFPIRNQLPDLCLGLRPRPARI